jgi:hypothetical protein
MKTKSMRRSNRNRNRNRSRKNKTLRGGSESSWRTKPGHNSETKVLKHKLATIAQLNPYKDGSVTIPQNPGMGVINTIRGLSGLVRSPSRGSRAYIIAQAKAKLPGVQKDLRHLVTSREFVHAYKQPKAPGAEFVSSNRAKLDRFAERLGYVIVTDDKGTPVNIVHTGRPSWRGRSVPNSLMTPQ